MFHSSTALQECIAAYFKYLEGEFELVKTVSKSKNTTEGAEEKVWLRQPEPPTLAGLAWYLGFTTLEAFEKYEHNGRYRIWIRRARLRIEAEYEKKLHGSSSTGAIFALKTMGWNDKTNALPILNGTIKIELIKGELKPAGSEADVEL